MSAPRRCVWDDVKVPQSRGRDRFCSERCRQAQRASEPHRATAPHVPKFEPADYVVCRTPLDAEIDLFDSLVGDAFGLPISHGGCFEAIDRVHVLPDEQDEWLNNWWTRSSRERP